MKIKREKYGGEYVVTIKDNMQNKTTQRSRRKAYSNASQFQSRHDREEANSPLPRLKQCEPNP
jgi:hypothetical protein